MKKPIKKINFLLLFFITISCFAQKSKIAYFDKALTYQYEIDNQKHELWFYVNEKTKQILYITNEDMVQAVISYPDGRYVTFATDESGKKVKLTQYVKAVSLAPKPLQYLHKLKKTKIISQKNIQQKDILCEGFSMKYLKMVGGETFFATTQIPINSYQIYGFSQLDGDCKIPISLDYINVFKKNQMITHIELDNFTLELLNYGPNKYEFQLKDYK